MRHRREKHEGEEVEFEMKVLASFLHDPLARQCAEAFHIKQVPIDKRINNKSEWKQTGTISQEFNKNINKDVLIKNLLK